jgi:hypothetical protein
MVLIINNKQASVGDTFTCNGKPMKILAWKHPAKRLPLGSVFVEVDGKSKMFLPPEIGGKFQ